MLRNMSHNQNQLYGHMWYCDDECDCHQPQIEVRGPRGQFAVALITIVWRGKFISEPDTEELKQLEAELKEACDYYGIEPT